MTCPPLYHRKLQKMDENGIHDLTGCLASCTKDEYQTEVIENSVSKFERYCGLFTECEKGVTDTRFLRINLHYANGRYEEKKQYLIYDFNSMIADVGGYMGLLLGYSLLSLYEVAEQMWFKVMTTFGARKVKR